MNIKYRFDNGHGVLRWCYYEDYYEVIKWKRKKRKPMTFFNYLRSFFYVIGVIGLDRITLKFHKKSRQLYFSTPFVSNTTKKRPCCPTNTLAWFWPWAPVYLLVSLLSLQKKDLWMQNGVMVTSFIYNPFFSFSLFLL